MRRVLSRLAGVACLLMLVAACTGVDSGFGFGKKKQQDDTASGAQFPDVGAAATPGAVQPGAGQPVAATDIVRVYFAPVVGAPAELVGALSKRLGSVASANGVQLVPAGSPGMTHELKGYFSAFTENGNTNVIHVWDVVSPSGQRVHRIQSQVSVPGTAGDPWGSVTPETMAQIADDVMSQYLMWVRSLPPAVPQNPA